ncbi:MAG TPA: hypothetical protein ACFE0H_13075 [Elainellaceae cyanobacterium]
MEHWSQDWFKTLDEISETIEQVFVDATEGIVEIAQAFADLSDIVVEQAHDAIASELEQFADQVDEWIDPSVYFFIGIDISEGDFVEFTGYPVEPSPTQNPACMGCKHYHGHIYNDNLLVCAMHPFGWDSGDCPDWES